MRCWNVVFKLKNVLFELSWPINIAHSFYRSLFHCWFFPKFLNKFELMFIQKRISLDVFLIKKKKVLVSASKLAINISLEFREFYQFFLYSYREPTKGSISLALQRSLFWRTQTNKLYEVLFSFISIIFVSLKHSEIF